MCSRAHGLLPAGAEDVEDTGEKHKSNDSLLITVLWRRLSMFSRRGSTRSHRQSVQSQKLREGSLQMDRQDSLERVQESPLEKVQEETSEKG